MYVSLSGCVIIPARFDEELLCNYYKYFDDSNLNMNSENNSIPSESMESDIIKELYKKTPLKKRPIQPSSLSPDEKKISPKPRACTVPEGRLSKRKMLKPTKKLIDSYVESTAVFETAPKAVYVPVIKTSAEAKASSPVEIDNQAVNMAMAMAIPELKKTTCVETEVPSRFPKGSKALCKRNFTKQEWEDFNLAIELQKEEFNLRERRPRRNTSNLRIKLKRGRSPVKTEDVSAESMDSNSISSPEMPNEVGEKQGKQEIKRIPKQTSLNIGEGEKDAPTCLFTGSHSQNMYILSPELANIVGHKKLLLPTESKERLIINLKSSFQKEEYEEWMSIDEDIPVAATITDLEICQAVCEQDQAI
ncbi:hypothetical protein AVEN_115326-1 [Araneus ventricosus]|uniref:Uncharacterized protein n=1 Tax=Araneus ventricosus TaxID=182803 RepID=A0A4Y1ZZ52_ARAVE|nr:hypothetical protein AVEN_115326-1 [Araneus ventricosus]